MKKLYKIWCIRHPDNSGYDRSPYALEQVISVLLYYRDEVVSTNYDKLKLLCDRLNFMAGTDEHYEIREDASVAEWIGTNLLN